MIIDLDIIQKMWEEDSKIDMDNLHLESTKTSNLHAKYYNIFNNILLLKKKAEQQRKNIRHVRYEYYSGKADPEVYEKNPFPKKIRDKEKYKSFDDEFIQLARSVYTTNDERSRIKRRINETFGSDLIEEKSYADY